MSTRVPLLAAIALTLAALCPKLSAQNPDSLALIAPDSLGILTIQPQQFAQSRAARRLPLEVITAAGLEYFNFDPLKLERVDVIVGLPMIGSASVPMAVSVTHSEPIPQELFRKYLPLGPVTEKGVQLWPIPQTPDFVLSLRKPNQAIIGPKLQVMRLMKTTLSDGELRQVVTSLGPGATAQLVIALGPARELLASLTEFPQLQAIPDLAPNLKILIEKARMFALQIDMGQAPSTTYLIEGASAADASELAGAMKKLIELGMNLGIPMLEDELRQQPGQTPQATIAYVKRLQSVIQTQLDFKPVGNRLSVKVEGTAAVVAQTGTLVGLLLPAVQASRDAARRMQALNNLKQLMLAIHNYESALGYIPNNMGPDVSNKENRLSWRVHILPYIEQQALYQEFHLDEPWDSPHNIQLLERMPDTYRDPSTPAPPGHTVYQRPSGENTMLNLTERHRFRHVTDGLSNTLAIVRTDAGSAVPWTKPDDLDVLANPNRVANTAGNAMCAFADGSVRTLRWPLPAETLKALLLINDGQVIEDDIYR